MITYVAASASFMRMPKPSMIEFPIFHLMVKVELEIVRLLGPEALPDEEKLILDVARMIQIGFLQQNAYDDIDAYCSPQKQFKTMKMFAQFHEEALKALRNGVPLPKIRGMQVIAPMLRAKFAIRSDELDKLDALSKQMFDEFGSLSTVQEARAA